jgi:hypothetical protein
MSYLYVIPSPRSKTRSSITSYGESFRPTASLRKGSVSPLLPPSSVESLRLSPRTDRSTESISEQHCVPLLQGSSGLGEFTWYAWDHVQSPKSCLARKYVTFTRQGTVTLHLPASKTDPFRQGTDISLASTGSILCPVSALHTALNWYNHPF